MFSETGGDAELVARPPPFVHRDSSASLQIVVEWAFVEHA